MKQLTIRLLTIAIGLFLVLSLFSACGDESDSGKVVKTLTDCEIGEIDGYGYELWKDSGDTSMDLMEGGGNFSCQ